MLKSNGTTVDATMALCNTLSLPKLFLQVEYSFNFATAMPKEDWLGVVGWGDQPSASTCVLRKSLLETSYGAVCMKPSKYVCIR